MKNFAIALLVLLQYPIYGQCPSYPTASRVMFTPRAKIVHNPAGVFWWDGDDESTTIIDPSLSSSPTNAPMAGGLWYAAKETNGDIYMRTSTFGANSGIYAFAPGPITDDFPNPDICDLFDRIWEVRAQDIIAYQLDWNDNQQINLSLPDNIRLWPARGNKEILEEYGVELPNMDLAPFFDFNGNGIYDPLNGDYPDIRNASIAHWWMFNDTGISALSQPSIPTMDFAVLAYSFDDNTSTTSTFYYEVKLTNRSTIAFDEMLLGFWSDADWGCLQDDYVGCSPEDNMAYVYYHDEEGDGCPTGIPISFEISSPLVGIKILDGTDFLDGAVWQDNGMSSFTYMDNPVVGPTLNCSEGVGTVQGNWNMLQGLWPDGTPMTMGGVGCDVSTSNTTEFAFPDDPNDPNGWSLCSENIEGANRAVLLGSGPFNIPSQSTQRFSFALLITGAISDYPCPSIDPLKEMGDHAQEVYEELLLSSNQPESNNEWLTLFPNPTNDILNITLKQGTIQSVQIYDATGKLLSPRFQQGQQLTLDTNRLAAGLYVLVIEDQNGALYSQRFIKN